jgi:phosphatidylglycerol---prolipoprotein diacylglyceryl transferase
VRPRIVELLNGYFGHDVFQFIVPDPAVVYAVMLGSGILLFVRRCQRGGLSLEHATGMALWAALAALVGGRVFYLVQHLGFTLAHPSDLFAINGGTVSFGVYMGGVLGAVLYACSKGVAPLPYLDVLASVLGIGPMIGRWACFLNGDDYGKVSNVPWAVRYPHGSYPFIDHVRRGLIGPMADLSLPVHPVQLYLSLKGLVLFVVFSILWKKRYFKPGVLFLLFWICYACARFGLEYFRGDQDRGWIGAWSTGQVCSAVIAAASVIGIVAGFKGRIMQNSGAEDGPLARETM